MLEGSVSTLTQAMKESVERLGQETHNGTPLPADVDGLNRDGLDMDQGLCRALRRYDPQKVCYVQGKDHEDLQLIEWLRLT